MAITARRRSALICIRGLLDVGCWMLAQHPLRLLIHHPDQSVNVAERVRKRLATACIAFDARDVVRHQHSVVADFLVYPYHLDEVDVAIVRERLLEFQKSAFDIPEMYIENLVPASEITDDIWQLLVGIL